MSQQKTRNRRRADRLRLGLPFTLRVPSEGEEKAHDVEAVDLSKKGARLRTPLRLAPGEVVEVKPTVGNWKPAASRIIWTGAPKSDQAGEAGVEYLRHPHKKK